LLLRWMACALRAATSLQQGNARITAGGCQSFCLSVRRVPAPSAVLLADKRSTLS